MISSFKLSYYTMLNMLRRLEGSQHNMEYVIKNSFQQFQQERALPEVGVAEYTCSEEAMTWTCCFCIERIYCDCAACLCIMTCMTCL